MDSNKTMVRCKVCGYITPEGKLGDKCPACGALRVVFEPYIDTVTEPRRKVLRMDIHPVAVHFPTSFAVSILVLSVATLFFSGEARALLTCTVKILAILLPLVVILALIVGIVDGKIRFRKIRISMILKTKILYASILLVISLGLLEAVWLNGLQDIISLEVAIILAAIAVILTYLLGSLGASIRNSAFPGK
jgi:uncharacterized membrane protein